MEQTEATQEFIKMEDLEAHLNEWKAEFVRDVVKQIVEQLEPMVDKKIGAAVGPVRETVEGLVKSRAAQDEQNRKFHQRFADQETGNQEIREMFKQTGEQISTLTTLVNALTEGLKNVQTMVTFQGAEIDENRKMVNVGNEWRSRHEDESVKFRNATNQSINVLARDFTTMDNRVAGVETTVSDFSDQIGEVSDLVSYLNMVAKWWTSGKLPKLLTFVGTVLVTQADHVVNLAGKLLGG